MHNRMLTEHLTAKYIRYQVVAMHIAVSHENYPAFHDAMWRIADKLEIPGLNPDGTLTNAQSLFVQAYLKSNGYIS